MLTPSQRWSLLVAGEALLILELLTLGNSFEVSIPFHRLNLLILAALGGIGWLIIGIRPSRLPVLLVVAPLPVLFALVVTAIPSNYPSLSWFAAWQCAAYVGLAWLLAIQAGDPVGRRNLVAVMGIVVTVVVGIYLAQVLLLWAEWVGLGFALSSVPLRPLLAGGLIPLSTWVGDVVALCTPVVVMSLWRGHARTAAVALSAVAIVATAVSGTRSVLLMVLLLSLVAVALVVRERASRRVVVFAGLGATLAVVVGLGVMLTAGRSFDEGRTSAYGSAIDQFASSPIWGTGPGTYGVLRMSNDIDGLSRLAFPDAHNLILTMAGDSGLVGLIGLGLATAAYAVAGRRVWHGASSHRPVVAASVFGIAVAAGHAMVEVLFALIGVIVLILACIAIATTEAPYATPVPGPRSRRLDAALLAGVVAIALGSVTVVRTESAIDAMTEAASASTTSQDAALAAARRATEMSPDLAPAWWVRTVVADAAGDEQDAIASARRTVAVEGFGQEWLSLAILLERAGDRAGARDAIDRARAHLPIDPVVELNAINIYQAAGARDQAEAAARRLVSAQPDIEPILAGGPPVVADLVAEVRAETAASFMSAGDPDSAFVVALSGEDRDLSTSLLATAAHADPLSVGHWKAVVGAWFGDRAARSTLDQDAIASPNSSSLEWAWRVAVHACDGSSADRWRRAGEIGLGREFALPSKLGIAPTFESNLLPRLYPGAVWRIGEPYRPYVAGTWTWEFGARGKACDRRSSGALDGL